MTQTPRPLNPTEYPCYNPAARGDTHKLMRLTPYDVRCAYCGKCIVTLQEELARFPHRRT